MSRQQCICQSWTIQRILYNKQKRPARGDQSFQLSHFCKLNVIVKIHIIMVEDTHKKMDRGLVHAGTSYCQQDVPVGVSPVIIGRGTRLIKYTNEPLLSPTSLPPGHSFSSRSLHSVPMIGNDASLSVVIVRFSS